jgi:hypothetical protein
VVTLGVSERTLVQGSAGRRLFLDVGQRVRLRPDISLWHGDRCLFVADVKYKRIVPAEYQHADLYQLTAYAIATGLPSGVLIYAAGADGEQHHDIVELDRRLSVVPLDLTVGQAELRRQIDALASRLSSAARVASIVC